MKLYFYIEIDENIVKIGYDISANGRHYREEFKKRIR